MNTEHENEVEEIASLMHKPIFEAVAKASEPLIGVEALAFLFAIVAIGSRPLRSTHAECRELLLTMIGKELDEAISAEIDDQPAG